MLADSNTNKVYGFSRNRVTRNEELHLIGRFEMFKNEIRVDFPNATFTYAPEYGDNAEVISVHVPIKTEALTSLGD